jgi:hypothetical protein
VPVGMPPLRQEPVASAHVRERRPRPKAKRSIGTANAVDVSL